jgi:hypothetical protein
MQEPRMRKEKLSFVVTLEPVAEPIVLKAVAAINQFPFMVEPVFLAPITDSAG